MIHVLLFIGTRFPSKHKSLLVGVARSSGGVGAGQSAVESIQSIAQKLIFSLYQTAAAVAIISTTATRML